MDPDDAPPDEWTSAYDDADGVNEKYHLLRREAKRLRRRAERPEDTKFTDDPASFDLLEELDEGLSGSLLVFAANDFGWPVALRPEGTPKRLQEEIRRELLREKYRADPQLNEIRRAILDADDRIHKALVVHHAGDDVRYHLPGGRAAETNFLTVREAVGLVDYITNGRQREAIRY